MRQIILTALIGLNLLFNSSVTTFTSSVEILTEDGPVTILVENEEETDGKFYMDYVILLEDGTTETILLQNGYNPETQEFAHDGGVAKDCLSLTAIDFTLRGQTIYKCNKWENK